MNIRIASYRRARQRLEADEDFDALVSIHDPGGEMVLTPYPGQVDMLYLHLPMTDWTPYRKAHKGLATGNDVIRVIEFARSLPVDSKVLVHCAAGRSRSSATAIIMYVTTGMSRFDAANKVFNAAPKSRPNGWILKLADAILDHDGPGLFAECKNYHRVKW